jgi:hypothetical protein
LKGFVRRLKRSIVPAVGICLIALVATPAVQARIKRPVVQEAGQAYSLAAIMDMNNNESKVARTSAPTKTRLSFDEGAWRYFEKWPLKYRDTGKKARYCWLYVVLRGSNSKVHIRKHPNGKPCVYTPDANTATYFNGSNTLDWGTL